jgi:hypothetical protein
VSWAARGRREAKRKVVKGKVMKVMKVREWMRVRAYPRELALQKLGRRPVTKIGIAPAPAKAERAPPER